MPTSKQDTKKSKKKKVETPEELFQKYQLAKGKFEDSARPREIKEIKHNPVEWTIDEKLELTMKGIIFAVWTMTLLFSGVLVLIAILYEFPINMAIMGIAVIIDIIAIYITRKYMK